MTHPVPPYLIAIAAGDIAFRSLGPAHRRLDRAGDARPRPPPSCVDTERMVEAAERLYGPYRWGRYDLLVLPPSFPYGGMENPTLTFLTPTFIAGDRSLVGLVAHELAHSWSGNLVTNAAWARQLAERGLHLLFREPDHGGALRPAPGGAGGGAELGRHAGDMSRDRRDRARHRGCTRRRGSRPGSSAASPTTRARCSCGRWSGSSAASAGTPICAPISIATPSSR